ncbi:MAG: glycosyl hydrolase family 28 protein [Planctomycetota bacterium]|jgi:hypothetical protein
MRYSLILLMFLVSAAFRPTNMKAGDEEDDAANRDAATVTIFPGPAGEEPSEDFEVNVNGRPVFVYRARVSAVPFNQVWPGYQRPLDQTEQASFAYWDASGPVTVEIVSKRRPDKVAIRPTSLDIRPELQGHRIVFRLTQPRHITVEVNGTHHALHLFASPPEKDVPKPVDPHVHYFGPGVHHPGRIVLGDNETVYVAGGAVVYGAVHATCAKNITIRGRGIIDVSPFTRGKGGGAIRLSDCQNITIDGIVMRDPDVWCCSLFGCQKATISNVKLIGLWRYNADGIDLCNSQDVTVTDCFVRSFDDSIVLKGLKANWAAGSLDDRPVSNIRVRRCVIWNDWGRALEIGAETCAPEVRDVVFEDCDIIHTCHIAMDIQHGDRATIESICFENIRAEIDDEAYRPKMQRHREEKYDLDKSSYCPALLVLVIRKNNYSKDVDRGRIRDVLVKDVTVSGKHFPHSSLQGYDSEHLVENVRIENLRVAGEAIGTAEEGRFRIGKYVSNVEFNIR